MKTNLLLLSLFFALPLFSQPVADGLICWFPFNGNANDESGHGHNGAVSGPLLITDRHGDLNSAYLFDGVNDFILVPDHPELRLGNTSFTISAWVRPDGIEDLQSHTVLSKRTGSGNQGYLFQLIGTNHVMGLEQGSFDIVTSGGWTDPKLTTNAHLTPQAWHHVLYCFDQATGMGQFFIDNIPDIQGQMIEANGLSTGDFYIGKDKLTDGIEYPSIEAGYFGGFHFFGAVDDIRIYNRKLTQSEQGELFQEGVSIIIDEEPDFSISIYPDPVGSFLNILAEGVDIQTVRIHDVAGRQMMDTPFFTKLDCRYLPAGAYFISFFDKNEKVISSNKFIKIK